MSNRNRLVSWRGITGVVGSVTVAVTVAGLPLVAPVVPVASAVEPSTGSLERPDSVSAMVTARALDERVEDLSRRSEVSQVFANPDGTWTSETASEPVRVVDDSGEWHDVDPTLVERDGVLAPAYSVAEVEFSAGGDNTFAAMTEGGRELEWRWPSALPEPSVEGPTATYAGAGPDGADLVVTATATGFTHNIVLHQAPTEPVEFTFPVVTDGAELTETAQGGLEIDSPAGKTLVEAPRPLMWDSSENVLGESENVAPVETTVEETASGTPTLTLSPDEDYLNDPETVYPVTVDPSFTTYPSSDTWVQSPDFTSSQGSSSELRAGTYDSGGHKARSFMHFEDGDVTWSGKSIVSASLVMRNWHTETCSGGAIRAARITESWNNAALTWANQPTITSTGASDSTVAKGASTPSCPTGDVSWNVKSIVQVWADNTAINYGIRLSAVSETNNNTWRRYRSANYDTATSRPRLVVTYSHYPNTAGTPIVSPGNPGYVTTTTPTFKAIVSDPDGASLMGEFTVTTAADGVVRWTGQSGLVPSGKTAYVTMNSGLANGTRYAVRVKGYDGALKSKSFSSTVTFTVDTTKPTVTTTASAFTDGVWATTPPSSNTFTFDGPTDTKSFAYSLDGVAQPAKMADSNGNATLAWLPEAGGHVVGVTPTDKAGNVGDTVTFTFGVGAASFTTPVDSTRSTGVFPVQVSGPPGATSATLEWRRAGHSNTDWVEATEVTTAEGGSWATTNVTDDADGFSVTPELVWDAAAEDDPASTADPQEKLAGPALIELQTCFQYPSAPEVCSAPRRVQLVPSAFGGTFPVAAAGPASVALATGEMSLSEADAVDTAAGLGRTFSSFDAATAQEGAYGPGWASTLVSVGDTGADLVDHRDQDRTFVMVTSGGGSQMFTPDDPNIDVVAPTGPVTFVPAGVDDGSRLVLDGTTVTLTRPLGAVTTWEKDTAGEWKASEAELTGAPDVTVYPNWVAETTPGTSTTCTESVQEVGCRGLKITYTGTAPNQRVSHIDRVAGASTTPTITRVATYTYTNGLLDTVCGTDPDAAGPLTPLCSSYEYDTATVPGRTLLDKVTPPGQKPWSFHYDSSGRLTTVTRALDEDTNSGTGPATWTVAYDLDPATSGLPDLSAATAAQWGQTTLPTKAFAVFTPAHVPSSTPTSGDLEHASLWFTTEQGVVTNTAVHGNVAATSQWLVDTVWYDEHENVIRSLDAAGRARALAAPTADRPSVAYDASSLTEYNNDGDEDHADGDGRRVENEYSPAHTARLKDGTSGQFRVHTEYAYDDENTSLGGGSKPAYDTANGQTSFDLVVETRHSAAAADTSGEYDVTVVRNEYDPVVSGDGNGWTLGTPTRVKVDLGGGNWSTTVTRYDDKGRQIETRQPGGGTASDGSGNDAHTTTMSYYQAGASDGQCTITDHPGRASWVGLPCKTGPAGQPTGPTMPVTYNAAYNDDFQPTTVTETSGSATRTTTQSYDDLGRPVTRTVTDGTDTRTSTTGYDAETGLPISQTEGGETVQTQHDTWARPYTYTDASGLVSTTTYTKDSQPATINDGVGTYTYTYDGTSGEHRRLPTSVDFGLTGGAPDVFTLTYDTRGAHSTVTYPNGMVATHGYDDIGVPVSLDYSDGGTGALLSFTADVDVAGRVLGYTSTASQQDYTYDALGRLTKVQDTRADSNGDPACTTRTYGFSEASERTAFGSYGPGTLGACQATNPTISKTNTYDSANRIRNTGYTYDSLGRTLTTPAGDTAPGGTSVLSATYYANDMIKSLAQTVDNGTGGTVAKETIYQLDPTGRIDGITNKIGAAEASRLRYRFSGDSDAPSSIQTSNDSGSVWATTRYVSVPGLGAAVAVTNGTATYQLANLHGDIIATQIQQDGTPTIDSYSEADEYGRSSNASNWRYSWLGSSQRASDSIGSLVLMGARAYNPQVGAFLSPDPMLGGNRTTYGYPEDPINSSDVTGKSSGCDDNLGCDEMWDACRDYGNWFRCNFLFSLLQHVLKYSVKVTTNVNYQNAGRHFAFMVMSSILIGVAGAKAMGYAHEIGATRPLDTQRDTLNNSYSRGWYGRHTKWANSFVGFVVTRGDMERLFWHGVDLFKRGYMWGICGRDLSARVHYGPC